MPPFPVSLLLSPTLFSVAVAQHIPTMRNRPQGLLDVAGWAQGRPPEDICLVVESLASEIRRWAELDMADGMHRGTNIVLHQGPPTGQRVTDVPSNKRDHLFWHLGCPAAERRILRPRSRTPPALAAPAPASLSASPIPAPGVPECPWPGQTGKHEGSVSLHPSPNSLELFTLFSLPFLHFYNFLGTQGGGRRREEPGAVRPSVGCSLWALGSCCPFFSSSQDSQEGLTGILPHLPGPSMEEERGI